MDNVIRMILFILVLGAAPAFAMGDRDPHSEPSNSGARMGSRQSSSPVGVSVTPGAATGGSISSITSTGEQSTAMEEAVDAEREALSDTEVIEDTTVSDLSTTRSTPVSSSTARTFSSGSGTFSNKGPAGTARTTASARATT